MVFKSVPPKVLEAIFNNYKTLKKKIILKDAIAKRNNLQTIGDSDYYSILQYYNVLQEAKRLNLSNLRLLLEKNYFSNLYNINFDDSSVVMLVEKDFFLNKRINDLITKLIELKITSKKHCRRRLLFKLIQYRLRGGKLPLKTVTPKPFKKKTKHKRRKRAVRLNKKIAPDLEFLSKFASSITKHGLKKKAFGLINSGLQEFRKLHKLKGYSNFRLLAFLSSKVNPSLYLRKFHLGRRQILIPFNVRDDKLLVHKFKLIKKALRLRPESSFKDKLSAELRDLANNKGYIKKQLKLLSLLLRKNSPNTRFLKTLDKKKKKR